MRLADIPLRNLAHNSRKVRASGDMALIRTVFAYFVHNTRHASASSRHLFNVSPRGIKKRDRVCDYFELSCVWFRDSTCARYVVQGCRRTKAWANRNGRCRKQCNSWYSTNWWRKPVNGMTATHRAVDNRISLRMNNNRNFAT